MNGYEKKQNSFSLKSSQVVYYSERINKTGFCGSDFKKFVSNPVIF